MPRKFTKKVAKTRRQQKLLKSIHPPSSQSDTEEDQQEYEIEKLVDVRGAGAKREFFVKWLNWPANTNTWEKADGLPQELIDQFDARDANTSDDAEHKDASISPAPQPPSRRTRSRGRPRKRSVSSEPSSLDPPEPNEENDEEESGKKSKSSKSRKSDGQQRAQKKKKKKIGSQEHPSDADVESSPSIVVVIDEDSSVETPAPIVDEDATPPPPPKRAKRSTRAKRRRPIDDVESEDLAQQPPAKKRKVSGATRTRPGATKGTSRKKKSDEAKEEEKADELQKEDLLRKQTPTPMDVDDADVDADVDVDVDDANDDDDEEYAPETEELNEDDDAEDETMSVSPKRRVSSSTSMDVVADDMSSEVNDKKDEVDEQDGGDKTEDEDEDDDAQWEVEKIVACRPAQKGPRRKAGKRLVEYEVKWKGWQSKHNSWVHENDCAGCSKLIEAFEKSKESTTAAEESNTKTKRRRTGTGSRTLENSESAKSPPPARPKRGRPPKVDKDAVGKWKAWVNAASGEELKGMLLEYADRASSREIWQLAQDFRMNLESS